MSVSRNLKTESGKATWSKVEQAANNAPQWVKNNVKESAAKAAKKQSNTQQPDQTQQS